MSTKTMTALEGRRVQIPDASLMPYSLFAYLNLSLLQLSPVLRWREGIFLGTTVTASALPIALMSLNKKKYSIYLHFHCQNIMNQMQVASTRFLQSLYLHEVWLFDQTQLTLFPSLLKHCDVHQDVTLLLRIVWPCITPVCAEKQEYFMRVFVPGNFITSYQTAAKEMAVNWMSYLEKLSKRKRDMVNRCLEDKVFFFLILGYRNTDRSI